LYVRSCGQRLLYAYKPLFAIQCLLLTHSPPGRGVQSTMMGVAMSVQGNISGTTGSNFSNFCTHYAVTQSSSGGVAICYLYFRFCGWRHVFTQWALSLSMARHVCAWNSTTTTMRQLRAVGNT